MVSHFFETFGAKNTVNTDVFYASASGSTNQSIYSVFWTAPSLRSFRHVARSDFSMRKLLNQCSLLGLILRFGLGGNFS